MTPALLMAFPLLHFPVCFRGWFAQRHKREDDPVLHQDTHDNPAAAQPPDRQTPHKASGFFTKPPEKQVKKPRTAAAPASTGKGLKMSSFCAMDGETLVLNILGTPGAKKDAIGKAKGAQLKISVTAAPVAGKATDHMVRFLADEFGVATADITVVFGRFNINKQLRIRAPGKLPAVVAKALSEAKS